ncbi:Uncharacterised protein [Mycobacterium tuberculosis]|nr:Uncharacterised protein [Mycobacterium tuberculosis]
MVTPAASALIVHTDGAVWYIGAGLRYTESASIQKSSSAGIIPGAASGETCGNSRLIPFGRPVVPDEYCSRSPSRSSSIGVSG